MSGEAENIKKEALKTLLDYSAEETFHDAVNSFRANESTLIFGDKSFVSFVRGMSSSYDGKMDSRNQSTPIHKSKNKENPFTEGSSGTLNIPDSEFFDSETGKQQILNDEASHQRLMQRTDCTGCSSWTLCSQKNVSSLSVDFSAFKQRQAVSVGELIGEFSETISFSDHQKKQNPFLNCVETPINKRKSMSMSSLLDINDNELKNASLLSFNTRKDENFYVSTPISVKPSKILTPKWTENKSDSGVFPFYIGSTARKNIQRLKKERKHPVDESFSFNSLEVDKTVKRQLNCSSATRSNTSTHLLTIGSLSNSCQEQWSVEPQLVILDPNKGNRVRLINNSRKILKYKTTFDARMVNVGPLSGTVPAMDQIGLRIIMSQYGKKKNVSFEGVIKIVIGKCEKTIHIKFFKEEKSKSSRDRSFILQRTLL